MGALLGLLAVLAVAVRNAVMLISRFEHLRVDSVRPDLELVRKGAQERVVAVLTTSIATILVFLPFAFAGNRPGLEVVNHMALIILGGTITSVAVNLLLIPSLYLWIAPSIRRAPTTARDHVPLPAD